MISISPFVWLNQGAETALTFYENLFADSEVVNVIRTPQEGSDNFMSGTLRIGNMDLMLFNGGQYATFDLTTAFSLFVLCEDQAEVDRYWFGLTENGAPGQCGWLTDQFGISWQIVPKLFNDLMSDSDSEKTSRVMSAMMSMTRFDCEALQAAFDGS